MTGLRILRLGHQGDGIAQGPDGDIYVPFSLPGELVDGEMSENRIATPRISQPSGDRVTAPCPHFKSCGGCGLQHASDEFLARWKTDLVKSVLAAGGFATRFRPIHVSPPRSRRRATLAGRRTKKGAHVGFHARASDTIVPVPSCTVLHPDIVAGFEAFEALTKLGASRKGSIAIGVTVSKGGLDVDVRDAKTATGPLRAKLAEVCNRHNLARLSWNAETIVTLNPPVQDFGTSRVVPPSGGFLQATLAGQAALTDAVLEVVDDAKHVADLFAGCGTFSLPMAERAAVTAVECEDADLEALQTAWRENPGLKSLAVQTRDLFRRPLLVDELATFDAVVIDPPRAGARAQTECLAASGVKRVAFVSCNPATFTRDAATLVGAGYRLNWVQVVDQFRWSPHVELVGYFSRD